ncbi:unnamed protein product [Microthlaspi erraticum]|uniref:Transposase MuDR plant domain-containing protein n=1 Tax=Microthlaspi erraticum TaxID=1685480 RepID=A0A6D2J662_9BRAS|nr:unnamed protein product [Microthlaspi erraticum]
MAMWCTMVVSGQDLVTPARSLFQELPVNLYGQRIWYKLPFQDLKELRILCGEDTENFESMCEASKWTTLIEIYMEADEGDNGNDAGDELNEERGSEQNEERGDNGREEQHMCEEEETIVENLVSAFVNEEENDDYYQRTPPTSDSEGGEIPRCPYDRWRRGSGELKISLVFESMKEFREAVIEYALKAGWNIQFSRWGKLKCSAVCGIKKCEWRIYCSYERPVSMWMIKTFQDQHTCLPDGRCRILSQQVICDMFINELRNDPS